MDGELIPTEPSGPIPPAVGTDEVAFNSTVARASRADCQSLLTHRNKEKLKIPRFMVVEAWS